jgi:cohesin loading factor subunit SCC2
MDEQHADLYLETMLERVLDTGKSVRKRCIRILYDMLCANPLHQRAAMILVKLAGRVDDEDSIREMVTGAFRDLWFNSDLHPNTATYLRNSQAGQPPSNGVGAGLGTGTSIVLTLAQRVNQLLDVLRASQQLIEPRERNLVRVKLVSVITGILGLGDRGPEKKPKGFVANSIDFSLEDMSEMCGRMCDQLVEYLLRIDECERDDDDTRALPGSISPRMCCILALHIFCKSSHTFLCRHITTIEPYLQGGNGSVKEDTIVMQYSADMIHECIPHVTNMEQHFVTTLERDLLNLIYTSPNQHVVQSCVRCYCACFEWALPDDTKIRHVLEQFYIAVLKCAPTFTNSESSKAASQAPPTMLKAFFAMGLMCRYYDFDQNKPTPKKARGASQDSTVRRVAKSCLLCAGPKCRNFNVQSRAMHALGNVFCRIPMLLLEPDVQSVLEGAMSSQKAATKQQVLKALTQVLVEDERKNQTKEAAIDSARKPKTKFKVEARFCDTADDTKVKVQDTGLSGGLMQLYFKTLLKLAHDKTAEVRKDAVCLVGIILRQGLVHPMECVAHLVALESDRDEGVRAHVSRLLAHLDDKHHSLLRLRLVEGVFLSYEFQRRVFGSTGVIICWRGTEQFAFARVYSFVRTNRTERNDFIKAIVDQFSPQTKTATDLSLLAYLCSVLTTLPLGCKDEVHFLLSAATRVLDLHATAILDRLKQAFRMKSAVGQVGAEAGNTKPTREAARVLQPLREDCRAGTGMCLMVKVKRYIKACYGITESQILLYSSTESKLEKSIARRIGVAFSAKGLSLDADDATDDGALWTRFIQLQEHLKGALDDLCLLRNIRAESNEELQDTAGKRKSACGGRNAASPKKKRGRQPSKWRHRTTPVSARTMLQATRISAHKHACAELGVHGERSEYDCLRVRTPMKLSTTQREKRTYLQWRRRK